MNIGDQQNSHKWQFGFQWHRRGIELVFKSLDCFTKRLFHTAIIFCCYICICCLKLGEVFFLFCFLPRFGGGALSSNVFTICTVYWSLGRRGYFVVSNVVHVWLGIQYESIVWVIMGRKGVSSKRRCTNCYSYSSFVLKCINLCLNPWMTSCCCILIHFSLLHDRRPLLTHWGRDKMAAIFWMTFSNVFSSMKMYLFRLSFHWNLFLRVQLRIFQHWFR